MFFPILLSPCDFSQWPELEKRQFFMPTGADYGRLDIQYISYADLVIIKDINIKPLPDASRERYHIALAKAIETAILNHMERIRENDKKITNKEIEKSYFKIAVFDDIDEILSKYSRENLENLLFWLMDNEVTIAATCRRGDEFLDFENNVSHKILETFSKVTIDKMNDQQAAELKRYVCEGNSCLAPFPRPGEFF